MLIIKALQELVEHIESLDGDNSVIDEDLIDSKVLQLAISSAASTLPRSNAIMEPMVAEQAS
jgi:hypothetical protein